MWSKVITRKVWWWVIVVFSACLVGFGLWRYIPATEYPELVQLQSQAMNFGELSVFFTKLSQVKGAVYAYDVLKVAPLPQNTDMHLLGHVVGDELYKQKGIQGMSVCTQDFRNACSHSIVVGYFLKYGEAGLADIAQACRNAPGGSGAYTMCFHGLGHGILAAVDYDLERTVGLCQKTGTPEYGFQEAAECVGGAVMEIISGGFHNKIFWQRQSERTLSKENPLFPCTASYMPDSSKPLCLEYLTPHLVTVAGGSLDEKIPADSVNQTAFGYCKQLVDERLQYACFAGFGKEFIVLAHNRDTRTLDHMPDEEMRLVFSSCALAGDATGEKACLLHALDSLYWGGENDPKGAIQFCRIMEGSENKNACFDHLVGAMKYFVSDRKKQEVFCNSIPQEYQALCVQ